MPPGTEINECTVPVDDDLHVSPTTSDDSGIQYVDTPTSPLVHATELGARAEHCLSAFYHTESLQSLDEAVAHFRYAAQICHRDRSRRAPLVSGLARALRTRYAWTKNRVDIQEAISIQRDVLNESSSAVGLHELGASFHLAFQFLGRLADLEDAIRMHRDALMASRSDDPDFALFLSGLGYAMWEHFQEKGGSERLEEAVRLHREAVGLCQPQHPGRVYALNGLGACLCTQFIHSSHEEDLDEAIRIHEEALDASGRNKLDRFHSMNRLGKSLWYRYGRRGAPEDIEQAIRLHRDSLSVLGQGHPLRDVSLNDLALALHTRYTHTGDLDNLEEAIRHLKEALEMRKPGHWGRPVTFNTLAVAQYHRFECFGFLDDLEESIRLHRAALALRPVGNATRSQSLHNLAQAVNIRFGQLGAKDDLEETILLYRETLKVLGNGHRRPWYITDLGEALTVRFTIAEVKDPDDLEEAIRLHFEALSLTEPSHPLRSLLLNNLGIAFRTRFEFTGNVGDLVEAIRTHREAFTLRETGHPRRYHTLLDLSRDYMLLFRQTHDASDSELALGFAEQALATIPTHHALRYACHFTLARLHLERDSTYHSISAAIEHVLHGLKDNHSNAQLRLRDAVQILGSIDRASLENSRRRKGFFLEAHIQAVRLLPRVAYFGLGIDSRLQALREGKTLALEAASHALDLSETASAVEILEEGRAIFWTQALRLRSQFSMVPSQLRSDLIFLSRQLERDSLACGGRCQNRLSKEASEKEAARRRTRSEQFESLVHQVREHPGLERFMLHDNFLFLSDVAKDGPVVILTASSVSCDAIVIKAPGDAMRIGLPAIDLEVLRKLSRQVRFSVDQSRSAWGRALDRAFAMKMPKGASMTHVLAILWNKVVEPVIRALEFQPSSGRDRPRLWWCPTGQFAFLPIHAAGLFRDHGDSCSDFVVSSYTPTLGALLKARKTSNPVPLSSTKILLAAVPRPFKGSLLPATVREVETIKALIPAHMILQSGRSLSGGQNETLESLLGRISDATILHLASHGVHDPLNPLESGFVMADAILSISRLMEVPLPKAFLAFLSACDTAKVDRTQPDEAIHLAATMLFAGFKSIVATMWSMKDEDGPSVATKVYKSLFKGDPAVLDSEEIPYALDDAVQDLRLRKVSPERWATYIHIGV